jgi:hypothetical protein
MQSFSKTMLTLAVAIFTLTFGVSQASAVTECDRFENWAYGDTGSGTGVIGVPPATGHTFSYFTKALFVEHPGGTSSWEYHDVNNSHYVGTALFFGEELIVEFPDDYTTNVEFELMQWSGTNGNIEYSWNGGTWGTKTLPGPVDQGEPYNVSLNAPTMMMQGQTLRIRGVNLENSVIEVCLTHY